MKLEISIFPWILHVTFFVNSVYFYSQARGSVDLFSVYFSAWPNQIQVFQSK